MPAATAATALPGMSDPDHSSRGLLTGLGGPCARASAFTCFVEPPFPFRDPRRPFPPADACQRALLKTQAILGGRSRRKSSATHEAPRPPNNSCASGTYFADFTERQHPVAGGMCALAQAAHGLTPSSSSSPAAAQLRMRRESRRFLMPRMPRQASAHGARGRPALSSRLRPCFRETREVRKTNRSYLASRTGRNATNGNRLRQSQSPR